MEKEMVKNQGFEEFLNKIETSRNAKADKLKTQFGFDEVNWVLTNSFYFVRNGGKWGLMTESGEWRVPCEMDDDGKTSTVSGYTSVSVHERVRFSTTTESSRR